MEDSRWPKKIYQWTLHCRMRKGRPQQSWKNQVTNFMRSGNIEKLCIDPNSKKKYEINQYDIH